MKNIALITFGMMLLIIGLNEPVFSGDITDPSNYIAENQKDDNDSDNQAIDNNDSDQSDQMVSPPDQMEDQEGIEQPDSEQQISVDQSESDNDFNAMPDQEEHTTNEPSDSFVDDGSFELPDAAIEVSDDDLIIPTEELQDKDIFIPLEPTPVIEVSSEGMEGMDDQVIEAQEEKHEQIIREEIGMLPAPPSPPKE